MKPEDLDIIRAIETATRDSEEKPRRLTVDITEDFASAVAASGRTIYVPRPTLGMLKLYAQRTEYFTEGDIGLGRLLWALNHQYDDSGGAIRRLRAGGEIPEEEAQAFIDVIPAQDVADYYVLFWSMRDWADDENKKKVESYFHQMQPTPSS